MNILETIIEYKRTEVEKNKSKVSEQAWKNKDFQPKDFVAERFFVG